MSKRLGRILDFFPSKQPRIEHTSNTSGSYSYSEVSLSQDLEGSNSHPEEVEQVLPSSSQSVCNIVIPNQLDIGLFVSDQVPVNMELRSELLTKCWTPPSNYVFPFIIQGGQKRYFNRSWLLNYRWLAYSECLTGAFCNYV